MLLILSLALLSQETILSGRENSSLLRFQHLDCFAVVRVVDREIELGKNDTAIASELSAQCDSGDVYRKTICSRIADHRIPKIRELVSKGRRPDFICDALGYTRSFASGHPVSQSTCLSVADDLRPKFDLEKLHFWHRWDGSAKKPVTDPEEERIRKFQEDREKYIQDHQDDAAIERPVIRELRPTPTEGAGPLPKWVRNASSHRLRESSHGFSWWRRSDSNLPKTCNHVQGGERIGCILIARFLMKETNKNVLHDLTSAQLCDYLVNKSLIVFADEANKTDKSYFHTLYP
jgi:hypothetical protein